MANQAETSLSFNTRNVTLRENQFDGGNVSGTPGQAAGAFGCVVPVSPGQPPVLKTGAWETYNVQNLYSYITLMAHYDVAATFSNFQDYALISTYDDLCPTCSPSSGIIANNNYGIVFAPTFGPTTGTVDCDGLYDAYNSVTGIFLYGNVTPTAHFYNNVYMAPVVGSTNTLRVGTDGHIGYAVTIQSGSNLNQAGHPLPATDVCPPR